MGVVVVYLREGVPDEGLHNLSTLLPCQCLPEQVLLPQLPDLDLLAGEPLLRLGTQLLHQLLSLALILEEQHLGCSGTGGGTHSSRLTVGRWDGRTWN